MKLATRVTDFVSMVVTQKIFRSTHII